MSQTNGDSKKYASVVGGDASPLENGKVEMPPKQAISLDELINSIKEGEFTTIKLIEGNNLSKEQMEELNELRANRRTHVREEER
ncbi:MAG: hypothetical protein J6M60_02750 [Clostridia bacterium]|nr:hypothetical protein [Clostridia bacterium]